MKAKVLVTQSCLTLCDPMDCVAHQGPLSMEFSRQEYWSGLPFPSPGDLPHPGIKPGFLALQADSLPCEPPGKPLPVYQFKNLNPDPRPYLESFNGSLLPTKSRSSVFFPTYLFNKSAPLDIMREAVQSCGWIYSLWAGMPAQSLRGCILK